MTYNSQPVSLSQDEMLTPQIIRRAWLSSREGELDEHGYDISFFVDTDVADAMPTEITIRKDCGSDGETATIRRTDVEYWKPARTKMLCYAEAPVEVPIDYIYRELDTPMFIKVVDLILAEAEIHPDTTV